LPLNDRRRSGCLPSQQTCSLRPPSWIKHCSGLSTSSDCLYGGVVCSRDTAYTTDWIRVIAYPSVS
jgi:hypothetical protein